MGSASYALATRLRNEYELAPMLSSTVVPLMLLSGILLPMTAAPGWLYAVSLVNPLSHVVDAERALAAGDLTSPATFAGTVATVVLLVACTLWGIHAFRRTQA